MFAPGTHSESEVLLGFLAQQLEGLRAAAHGLTDEQARATPCRSALSVGGLVKHATHVLSGRLALDDGAAPDEAAMAVFLGSFALGPEETLAGTLAAFDAAAQAYLEEVRTLDPGAPTTAPPAPWDGLHTPTPSVHRYRLVHHVEELARHAGHADILREELDGASAASLLMAVQGREGNPFVQPWTPAEPG